MAIVTLDEIRDSFLTWGNLITNRIVMLGSFSEVAKPKEPYLAIILTTLTASLRQNTTLSVDGLTESINRLEVMQVTCDLFGGNAMQAASLLLSSLASSQRFLDLWLVCGHIGTNGLRDLSFLETGTMRQRAQLTFIINARVGDSFTSDSFDTVETTVEANGVSTLVVKEICNE